MISKIRLSLMLVLIVSIAKLQESPNIVFILADDWGWIDWQMNGDSKGSTFY